MAHIFAETAVQTHNERINNGGKLMRLDELYSTAEAAKYAGRPLVTFRNHIKRGHITPIALGEREYKEKTIPHGFIFTRRMLDLYKEQEYPVKPTKSEEEQIFNVAGAAEYLDTSPGYVRQAYHMQQSLPGKTIGRDTVFLLRDLIAFQERTAPSGTDHYRSLLTEEQVKVMRKMYGDGMSLNEIKEKMDLDMDTSGIWRVVTKKTYKNV